MVACSYHLTSTSIDLNDLYVFLSYGANPVPASCNGEDPCPLQPGSDTWSVDPVGMNVNFFGAACRDIQNRVAVPLIVAGCGIGPG